MNKLEESFSRNKKWLYFALIVTFIWGLLAHGYGFTQSSYSHDSLVEFCGEVYGNHFKFQTGRFLSPLYRLVFRTSLTLPWLIGVLSLVWISLAVFLVCRIFKIESKIMFFLIAGIFTTNITVLTTSATYMHDLDCDMVALLCSVAAVYVWQQYRHGWLAGALLVMISLAFYQAYITVTIVLAMFVCILDILNGKSFKTVFVNGIKAIGMLLIGGCMYYFAMKTVLQVTGLSMITGKPNTMDKPLEMLSWEPWVYRYLLDQTYLKWYARLTEVVSPFPALTRCVTNVVLMIAAFGLVIGILSRKVRILEKLLCVCLIVLLPFAMNLMYVLTIETAHEVMLFAIWLTYLLVLLIADWLVKWLKQKDFRFLKKHAIHNLPAAVSAVLVCVILYGNVQTGNVMYLKKDMEQDAYLSLMTRIVYRMEDYEGYIPGETPVVFVGLPNQINAVIPGFERYANMLGMDSSDVLAWHERDRWQAYFGYILSNPAVLAEEEIWNAMQTDSRSAEMPCYPEDGCIEILDDVLVVKLS